MDPERILFNLNSGKGCPEEEIERIASLLEAAGERSFGLHPSPDDIYSYILIIGRAQAFQYRNLVERYISVKDSLTVSLVLEILCLNWNLTEEYLEHVFNLSLGVPWDDENDVQEMALKILGEYLHAKKLRSQRDTTKLKKDRKKQALEPKHVHALELVFAIFEDSNAPPWLRRTAYFSLSRAAGREWEELPSECAQIDFSDDSEDLDREMLDYLRGCLKSSPSNSVTSGSSGTASDRLPGM